MLDNLPVVKTVTEALPWQRGFTNMAQALEIPENKFKVIGCSGAQTAGMLATDGEPTLLFDASREVVQILVPSCRQSLCPKGEPPERLNERPCNTLDCIVVAICVAKQGFAIASDGSGSSSEPGF